MRFSRRGFLQVSTGAVGLGAAGFPVQGLQAQEPAPRSALHAVSNEALGAFEQGVAAMRARQPSDPTSWFFQAAVHSVPEAWVTQAAQTDPAVLDVDSGQFWNQCPHGEGRFHDFLIWHRAYLYHFERILRQASGDPTFSIPYWNYDDPAHRAFPEAFARQQSPLFDARREILFMNGILEVAGAADATAAMQAEEFFGLVGFGGTPESQGLIEQVPHGTMHTAIGGAIQDLDQQGITTGLMTRVPTAGFDPIFWVHHANIDRLWRVWECQANRSWGAMPEGWLDEAPWSFHDADGSVQNHPRRFYLEWASLGISYDTDPQGCTPLSATLPTLVAGMPSSPPAVEDDDVASEASSTDASTAIADAGEPGGPKELPQPTIFVAAAQAQTIGRFTDALSLSAEEPATATVEIESPAGGTATDEENAEASAEAGAEAGELQAEPGARTEGEPPDQGIGAPTGADGRTIMVLEDIMLGGAPSVRYDVYVNRPEAQNASTTSPFYVGTIDLFSATRTEAHGSEGHGVSQTFDISRALRESGNGAVEVEIVPVNLYGAPADVELPKRSGEVTVGGIRVERAE